ncbi:MAG: tail fiber protein [Pyrinomonadaceae bacterium]
MADPFVAEIRIFPFNFAPRGWAFCQGQLMPLSQNTALFSLLGTTYGGDGKSTFALPDLQGAAPMQPGQGQGLSLRDLGEMSGVESITLLVSEIPVHTHSLSGSNEDATQGSLTASVVPSKASGGTPYQTNLSGLQPMNFQSLAIAGGGLPHNNMQPYLTLSFCIALQGVFPQRP